MNTWYDYRRAWSVHAWLMAIAALAVALIVLAIVETVLGGPLAFLFIPGLAVAYLHHLFVMKTLER